MRQACGERQPQGLVGEHEKDACLRQLQEKQREIRICRVVLFFCA